MRIWTMCQFVAAWWRRVSPVRLGSNQQGDIPDSFSTWVHHGEDGRISSRSEGRGEEIGSGPDQSASGEGGDEVIGVLERRDRARLLAIVSEHVDIDPDIPMAIENRSPTPHERELYEWIDVATFNGPFPHFVRGRRRIPPPPPEPPPPPPVIEVQPRALRLDGDEI